ncbi:MAG: F0F1 ATP synthase subunit A, partial [Bacteroidales bacterium]|nr:F0F1 ATP synthase subunit A [Bacteroidales bacterium]
MRGIKLILAVLLMAFTSVPLRAEELDMNEYLFGHVGDSYEWHITTVKGRPVSIPLPVIVHSKTSGWHIFSSKHLEEGAYEGFYISSSEKYSGKIVERGPSGEEVRPLDISITKNVAGLMFNSALLVLLVLLTARWYRKHDAREEAPRGLAGIMEMMITMVEDDIIKECIGKEYKRYSPYLLTAFFFIFINNL